MSDASNQVHMESAAVADRPGEEGRPARRWTRARTVWLLIAISLVPGVAAAVARDWWEQLPAGLRLSAYILSGILIVAACSLLVFHEDAPEDGSS
jgi:hypothetical protein